MNKKFELVTQAVDAQTDKMCAEAGMVTLGELAAKLEGANPEALIKFSDDTSPGCFDSYRGYYRYIALSRSEEERNVAELLDRVKSAIGGTFTGYKGGAFKMTKMTPVWVSEYGESSSDGIVDVDITGKDVILKVEQVEDFGEEG